MVLNCGQHRLSGATLCKNDFGGQQYARNQMVAKFLVKGPFFVSSWLIFGL
jgi:hypothetical protein